MFSNQYNCLKKSEGISMSNFVAIVCIKFPQGNQFCLFDVRVDSHFGQQGPEVIGIDLVWHDQQSWQQEVSLLCCSSPSTFSELL